MIKAWWSSRDVRERILIGVAGLLTCAILLVQFVLLPAQAFAGRQERAYAAALAEQADVRAALAGRMQAGAVESRERPLQAVLTSSAELYGLSIARLLPAEDEGLNLWIEDVPAELVYAWIAELERVHAVRVGRASIRRNREGDTVNVNLYVSRDA